MIPLHPRACPGDPSRLTWVTPPGITPFAGTVAAVPQPLAALLDDGTLTEIRLDATSVTTQLGPGRSWADTGPRVRTALHAALEQPDRWIAANVGHTGPADLQDACEPGARDGPAPTEQVTRFDARLETQVTRFDARLETTVRRLLNGPAGEVATAHGGGIELVDVHDGVVRIRLEGTCHGCPAAAFTVRGRLEAALRGEPGFRQITTTDRDPIESASRWRLPLPRKRSRSGGRTTPDTPINGR
jgi:Fe-S cluster biogenesis protein NfuA